METAELMRRAENALRTGQTENLFPVLARTALQAISEDRARVRREFAALSPSYAVRAMLEDLGRGFLPVFTLVADAQREFKEALQPVGEAWARLIEALPDESEPALCHNCNGSGYFESWDGDGYEVCNTCGGEGVA